MTKLPLFAVLAGALFLTSCALEPPEETGVARFTEEQKANIVIRYYSDSVNRVLKPLQTEGRFLSTFDKDAAVEIARQQSGRELAVVVLIRYNWQDSVKQEWTERLRGLGYERVVFLLGDGMKINGLRIINGPGNYTGSSDVVHHSAS